MNPLEAPYPVYLVRETEVVRNSLAEGLPLPQGDTLEVVLATMNLDSFSDPEAFGSLSLELAQAFALEAALLLKDLKERQALQEAARTDPLTGLGNRRALEEAFPLLLQEARTLGEPLSLIYWDLNGLKALNDREGHAVGDQALKSLAQALRNLSRRRDVAFRIGGDEFVS
ncbi:GGDEF domain-containing protein, partial [Thermus scotoductus]